MPDFDSRERALQRREQILQAVLAQSMQGNRGTQAGRFYVPPSALDTIGSVVNSFIGAKGLQKVDKETSQLEEDKKAYLRQQAEGLKNAPDKKTAAIDLIVESDPRLQQLGTMVYNEKPAEVPEMYGAPTELKVGDKTLLAQQNLKNKELKILGNDAPGQTINVGDSSLKTIFPKMYEDVSKLASEGEAAVQSQDLIKTLMANKDGTYEGPLANPAMWLAQLGNSMGVELDTTKLANTEEYKSASQQLLQRYISTIGGNRNITEKEQGEIAKAIPNLATSPEARARVSAILWSAGNKAIQRAQTAMTQFKKAVQSNDISGYDFGLTSQGTTSFEEGTAPKTEEMQLKQIKDASEWEALPPGTEYIDPQGNRRRKQ